MRRAVAGLLLVASTAASLCAQQFPSTTVPPVVEKSPETSEQTSTSTPGEAAPLPLATRQTSFTIPFSVDARSGTIEVQLHVSRDRGATWEIYARQRPDARQFLFRTDEDGEYWFASRLVDAQGRGALAPGEKLSPELRVRVDTTPPKADLAARIGPGGEIIATFSASDGDLVQESVRLEHQPAGDTHWQAVVLDPTTTKSSAGFVQGEARWFPKANQRAIGVRLVARDGAANTTIINRGVYLPGTVKAVDAGRSPAPLDVDPFRRDEQRNATSANTSTNKTAQPWPSDNVIPRVADKPPVAEMNSPAGITVATPVSVPTESAVGQRVGEANPFPSPSPAPSLPQEAQGDPFMQRERELPAAVEDDPRSFLPSGEQPRFTTRKRFKLDYDNSEIAPEHIADVELWGTHDGGKSWQKWGVDPDRQSPFEVEVEREGVFGFRIVTVHRNGMAGLTPRAGDAADIWVGVDTTQPVAKFGSIGFGKGLNAGQLDIQWTASDTWLSTRPITLLYATAPEGPWTTFAAGLANTGQYFWNVEQSVPRKIFLKLEVRDDAGNLVEDRTIEPLELEGLIPRGKIRGISPN